MTTPNDDDVNHQLSPSDSESDDNLNSNSEDESGKGGKLSAEERIDQLVGQLKQTQEELHEVKQKTTQTTLPPPPVETKSKPNDPAVEKAVEYLENLGFVRKQHLEDRVKISEDRSALNSEHTKLENKYSGEDGRPKYDRTKVEELMRNRGIYDPEVAYEQLYKNELMDWTIKKHEEKLKPKTYVTKPGQTKSGGNRWDDDNEITREKIYQSMFSPVGRDWYERNREKILEMTAKGQL